MLLGLLSTSTLGVLESITFPSSFDDLTAMRKPIEGSPREAFAAKHFGPILERQVGGDNQTLPLVGSANDVEQQLGS